MLVIVKPAHVVTSIKQSPVLRGHIFLVIVGNPQLITLRLLTCGSAGRKICIALKKVYFNSINQNH
jgi:hypothetical protein